MNRLVHILILHFHILFMFLFVILAIIASVVAINVGLRDTIPRLHFTIEVIYPYLQDFDIRSVILGLWGNRREGCDIKYFIVFLWLPLYCCKINLICWFLGDRSLQHNLIETWPPYLLYVDYLLLNLNILIQILTLLLNLLYLAMRLHIPKESLLIVVSTKVNQISNQIDNEIMLYYKWYTLVGLIRFCIFILKLNISSYL